MVETTIIVQLTRVGVRLPSLEVRGYHHLSRPVMGPRSVIQVHETPHLYRSTQTGVRDNTVYTHDRHHVSLTH